MNFGQSIRRKLNQCDSINATLVMILKAIQTS